MIILNEQNKVKTRAGTIDSAGEDHIESCMTRDKELEAIDGVGGLLDSHEEKMEQLKNLGNLQALDTLLENYRVQQ